MSGEPFLDDWDATSPNEDGSGDAHGSSLEAYLDSEDYYAFFNLKKDASDEEITAAYRRLSRLYHPDKHKGEEQKKLAENLFGKTQRVYDVLSDPHKRAIYDTLGLKGLQVEGWEVIHRSKTPLEIREEYERLARLEADQRLQRQTNPRGVATLSINASEIFSPTDTDYGEDLVIPWIEVTGMTFSQQIECPLTLRDTAFLSGQCTTSNGTGIGFMTTAFRRVFSPDSWGEVEVGLGDRFNLGGKYFRSLSKRTFLTLSGALQFANDSVAPGGVVSLGSQLDRHITGFLTYEINPMHGQSLSTSLIRDTERYHLVVACRAGLPDSTVSCNLSWKFPQSDARLRGGLKLGLAGGSIEYGVEKKVSSFSWLSATMHVGYVDGVALRVRLRRGNQSYVANITLCEELLPSPVAYGTVVPLVAWAVLKALVVDPYLREQKLKEDLENRRMNREKIAAKRREAESAVLLMQETYQRIVREEESKEGLIIRFACWGKTEDAQRCSKETDPNASIAMEEVLIDVTIPLQCHVKDSKLIIHDNTSKSQLPGFYDPCIGEDKVLFVIYSFRGQEHQCLVEEMEALRLPRTCE
ncbi:unnamed protein product [Cyprideis torosa]|uniref:Uncharacterized protein n=1 Tax=Cyprideis torosa TaxID=163714 RepID=A0A7R8ZNC1_9CRUS|nr:unnamed protein product [Cyprideis torosa]CAG0891239.1 unnamed protein product [Cyprideis torosa]